MGAVAFALAAMFNAETLVEMAERQPYGWQRTAYLAITRPIHTVSRVLFLDRPGEAVDAVRGRNREQVDLAELTVTPSAAAPDAAGTTTTTLAPLRRPSTTDPLNLWVGGDSMSQAFGQSLVRKASETGLVDAVLDAHVSTGLTRPDFFDWSARIVDVVQNQRPEVMVPMFGANDAQTMVVDGRVVDVDDPTWQAEYRRRVGLVMDYLVQNGVRVWWVGQPIMSSPDFTARMRILNGIYREEAASRPGITFVDAMPVFADAAGAYSAYLPDDEGEQRLMRAQDGVHLTLDGADRLADVVLADVFADLAPPSATPTTTRPPSTAG
ncbi:MAG: DUF459 domain-containing protein [Acidimicrobiales bacterium]|nr:DUF459 domain-containing protein [Acidimicrobiales bacterium]